MENKLPNILEKYINSLKGSSKIKSQTIEAYTYDLVLFLRFMKMRNQSIKDTPIDSIDISDVNLEFISQISVVDIIAYIKYITDKRNNGESAKARKISSLNSFYNYIVNTKRYIDQNPCVQLELPKVKKSDSRRLKIDDGLILLNGITGKHQYRDKSIISLFLYSDIKLSELISIKVEHVDLEGDTITICQSLGDKENPLNDVCKRTIMDYLIYERNTTTDCDYLFLSQRKGQMSVRTIQHVIKIHVDKNPKIQKRISSQNLRNIAAG